MIRHITSMVVSETNWISEFQQPITQRENYKWTNEVLHYKQVVVKIMGIPYDETNYYRQLYDLSQLSMITILSEVLDKTIPPKRFQALQKMYQLVQAQPQLSLNRFVAFLDAEYLLPRYQNEWQRELRVQFIKILQQFEQEHGERYTHPDFRRVMLDMIKWIWNHLDQWLKENDMIHNIPKIVWFGAMNKSQQYFLQYCVNCGFDIAILQPTGMPLFFDIANTIVYPMQATEASFPKELPSQQMTIAYGAQKEITQLLQGRNDGYFAPWALRELLVQGITLRTTYDEALLLWQDRAMLRPGFEVEKDHVKVPVLFAKISGVLNDELTYWQQVHQIVDHDNVVLIKKFPLQKENIVNNQYHYRQALQRDKTLNVTKMLKSNWWQYAQLHEGMQYAIATAICKVCHKPRLKRQQGETEEDLILYMFSQMMNLPEAIMVELQRYDYAQEIPKVVLYHNDTTTSLTRADVVTLLLLNELGVDIILFNPTGQNDIERYLETTYFDHHLLDDMRFNYEYQSQEEKDRFSNITSAFKNLLNRRRD